MVKSAHAQLADTPQELQDTSTRTRSMAGADQPAGNDA
jgi:hypothetical protein